MYWALHHLQASAIVVTDGRTSSVPSDPFPHGQISSVSLFLFKRNPFWMTWLVIVPEEIKFLKNLQLFIAVDAMLVTVEGSIILSNEQLSNAATSNERSLLGSVTSTKLVHNENALLPMIVISFLIIAFVYIVYGPELLTSP